MVKPKLLIATRSPGKRREIEVLLAELPYRLTFPEEAGLPERPEEEGLESADTFQGNAILKARYFARLSGLPTVAEDSGLEVFSLGGLPGVRSRRFAPVASMRGDDQDEANNRELLRRLAGAPAHRRKARYRCVVAYLERPDSVPQIFEGSCYGSIAEAPRGAGGFGYDPIFFSDDLGMTFGEAPAEAKHRVSHRGRAFRAFAEWILRHPVGS
ncbi:MAG: non-canonical purine NTP pyrophosphatase [Gemmatimonadales bacterium]|nr:MAG: non-canonical purine NTP pyrophosphatase [Gemmatimonadales bacterium]